MDTERYIQQGVLPDYPIDSSFSVRSLSGSAWQTLKRSKMARVHQLLKADEDPPSTTELQELFTSVSSPGNEKGWKDSTEKNARIE
jgi:hypothetical protein